MIRVGMVFGGTTGFGVYEVSLHELIVRFQAVPCVASMLGSGQGGRLCVLWGLV